MSENNSFGRVRWYSYIAFFLACCLTLSPLAWIVSREAGTLFEQTTEGTTEATAPPETTPEATTPAVTTPEETTPDITTPEDSFVTYTVAVVDENGAPLEGAIVQLYAGDKCLIPVLTNNEGIVTIVAAKADYTARVTLAGYVGEAEYHFVAGTTDLKAQLTMMPEQTTPDVTTPESGLELTPDGKLKLTHVTITAGDTLAEQTALSELTAYLEKRSITVGEGGFSIDLYIDASMDEDSYCVEAEFDGKNVGMDIRGGNGRGVLYGVYGFLEKYAGLRAFTPYLEVYPTEGDILIEDGKMIEYYPVFEMRVNDWYKWVPNQYRYIWCVKNGVNMVEGWWNSWDESLGGSWDYGGLFVHTMGRLTETGGGTDRNPCLALNTEAGQKNLATAIKNVRAQLESVPTATIISVSQNDADQCRCNACLISDAYYGSPAGTILAFVNAIANDIAEDYPNVIIDTLAYAYSQTPPKNIVPAENVCVRLCSITCCFTHPLNDPSCSINAKFCSDLEGWSAICDNIHIWDYTTNFAYYIPTYANLHVLQQNMQFFAENNAKGMFPQGNRNSVTGEFGELRAYLLAKLMMNPYMGEEEYYRLMDEFLEAYYGDGWAYIRMYIDKTSEIFSDYCGDTYKHPLARVPAEEFITHMQSFTEWWDKAEALADEDRKDNVHRSSLQWRWFLARFDSSLQPAFEQEVKDYGIWWSEGNQYNTRW